MAIAGGCGSPAHDTGNQPSPPVAGAGGSSLVAGLADPARGADADFLREAVQGNELELAMIALARRRGSDAIGELTKTLQHDHTVLQDALVPLAADVPATAVPVPAELGHLDGEQFDTRFLTLLRDQHALSVSKFEMAASDAALSDDVRKLASDALPTLRRNLERIEASRRPRSAPLAQNF